MSEQTIQYTEEDLRCALYTQIVDGDAAAEQSAPPYREFKNDEEKVYYTESSMTVLDLNDVEDRAFFEREIVPKEVERYRRGQQVLKTCKVLTSSRSIVCGDNLYDEMVSGETIVSPVIRISAGHIATSEAYRWAGLALRKTGSKRE